jgi:hypothetical protein
MVRATTSRRQLVDLKRGDSSIDSFAWQPSPRKEGKIGPRPGNRPGPTGRLQDLGWRANCQDPSRP